MSNKTEFINSAKKALNKMAENRAKVQDDVKHIVETISQPFVDREIENRKRKQYINYY